MAVIDTQIVKGFLAKVKKEITLAELRKEFGIKQGDKSFDEIRNIMWQLAERTDSYEYKGDEYVIKSTGQRNGVYKVIKKVKPVAVFSVERERRPAFQLIFPKDFETQMELDFAEHIVIREGDLVTLGGVKSKGKTTLCLNFCAENLDKHPVLMGNEYTVLVSNNGEEPLNTEERFEPAPRFLNRLDIMGKWFTWSDEHGADKFSLFPIRSDYAEYIVKDRINIIDWINLAGDKSYDIGKVLEGIKSNLGRGVAIIALQKGEGAVNPRGGQFVRDFSDVEILLDGYGDNDDDVLLTLKGAKEKHKPIVGKTYAYRIGDSGTKIFNFREVKKCPTCYGKGYKSNGKCDTCYGTGYQDN